MAQQPEKSSSKKPPAKKAFALRLDSAVHSAVERLAASELRSANAQMEMLVREALEARGIKVKITPKLRRGRPPIRTKKDG